MQLANATKLELQIHETLLRVEKELPASELATTIAVALSNAVEELQRLRAPLRPRMFPLQTIRNRDVQPGPLAIPWSIAEKAYGDYARRFGRGQSPERLAQRGGFCWAEMDDHYPAWRVEVDALGKIARACDWFLFTFQGDSGTGHTHWQQFPQYLEAIALVRAAGGPWLSASFEEGAEHV